MCLLFFFKQKTAYELRISDWSSDVCSSDLLTDTRGKHLIVYRLVNMVARCFQFQNCGQKLIAPEGAESSVFHSGRAFHQCHQFRHQTLLLRYILRRPPASWETRKPSTNSRSEERRVGNTRVRKCRSRGSA